MLQYKTKYIYLKPPLFSLYEIFKTFCHNLIIKIKTTSHKRQLTGLSPSIKRKCQQCKMATKGNDKDGEKVKSALIDGDNLENGTKEVNEELNSKDTLAAILAKQNDIH